MYQSSYRCCAIVALEWLAMAEIHLPAKPRTIIPVQNHPSENKKQYT